ncbi:hypothetical protein HAX54_043431 [Datura stramonium]|uniref:Uncharacterized protein n=1 Tax=Datura stramonium TaxID=4076 RepID=A0ABS8W0Z7_DATST|nr:hypothetical protein [Datura stramonium]
MTSRRTSHLHTSKEIDLKDKGKGKEKRSAEIEFDLDPEIEEAHEERRADLHRLPTDTAADTGEGLTDFHVATRVHINMGDIRALEISDRAR